MFGAARCILGRVPVAVIFRCEVCSATPDAETRVWLQRQLLDLRHGEYLDMEPGHWLVWHGRGHYGPTRYACADHRDDLKARLCRQYGTLGAAPWAAGPHPYRFRKGTDRARRILRGLPG
jgi:hypothetical protein